MGKQHVKCPVCGGGLVIWHDLNAQVLFDVSATGKLSKRRVEAEHNGEERCGLTCKKCGWKVYGSDDEFENYEAVAEEASDRMLSTDLTFKRS